MRPVGTWREDAPVQEENNVKRIQALRLIGVSTAAVLALAACSSGGGGGGGTGSSAAPGSKTLNVTLANHVWTDIVKKALPEFEQQTGIKVNLTQLGEDQLSAQYNVKLNAGTGEIDVMMYRPLQEGKLFAKNGWLADISKSVKADTTWNWGDFQAGPVGATTVDGAVVGVPTITEREVLYYRKDLLQAAGLQVPTTLDELTAAAKTLKEKNPGVAGFVARTSASAAVTQFSSFLYSNGGAWVDSSGKATLDTAAAKKSYAQYGSLIKDYGPANVSTDMSWPEAMAIFTQGNAALYTEADSLYKNATDPAKSKVADRVGFAPFPAGTDGSKPYNVPSWALGIAKDSANYDNAWAFIKWATSKDKMLQIQQAGVPGSRTSVWADPAAVASYPKDLVSAINASAKGGVGYDRPVVINVGKAREIVGAPIVAAVTGADLNAAVTDAQSKFTSFLASDK